MTKLLSMSEWATQLEKMSGVKLAKLVDMAITEINDRKEEARQREKSRQRADELRKRYSLVFETETVSGLNKVLHEIPYIPGGFDFFQPSIDKPDQCISMCKDGLNTKTDSLDHLTKKQLGMAEMLLSKKAECLRMNARGRIRVVG